MLYANEYCLYANEYCLREKKRVMYIPVRDSTSVDIVDGVDVAAVGMGRRTMYGSSLLRLLRLSRLQKEARTMKREKKKRRRRSSCSCASSPTPAT